MDACRCVCGLGKEVAVRSVGEKWELRACDAGRPALAGVVEAHQQTSFILVYILSSSATPSENSWEGGTPALPWFSGCKAFAHALDMSLTELDALLRDVDPNLDRAHLLRSDEPDTLLKHLKLGPRLKIKSLASAIQLSSIDV